MGIKITEEVLERLPYSIGLKINIISNTTHAFNTNEPQNITPGICYSSRINIDDSIEFQLMFLQGKQDIVKSFIKLTKRHRNDKQNYIIVYEHILENTTADTINKEFSVEDEWQSVSDLMAETYIFKLKSKLAPVTMSYANIHEDTELTDFELRAVNGSVRMHKAVAAAYSPFFKTLFSGSWRENTDNIVNSPESTVETLQQLKDYMYLGKLPEFGNVSKLLVLSSCYLMPDLETRCVYELCKHVTNDTAYDLIQFAVRHNMSQLLYELLLLIQMGKLDVNEMKNLYNPS